VLSLPAACAATGDHRHRAAAANHIEPLPFGVEAEVVGIANGTNSGDDVTSDGTKHQHFRFRIPHTNEQAAGALVQTHRKVARALCGQRPVPCQHSNTHANSIRIQYPCEQHSKPCEQHMKNAKLAKD
jgi:hypothetical protein